ncbi:MAG TPA: SHOCT domain-containing protein [Anaerolineae bacterium]|nr:SHOCT domain-containing protein [Anaerolineae bacterium]
MMRGGRRGGARGGRRAVARTQRRRRRRRRRRVILVGGLIAVGVYKLSKRDTERVEEHTGKKAEELSDEELDRAMDDLNIPKQELTDEEWEYVDAEDAKEDSAPVTSAPAGEPDYLNELARLSELHDQGVITDEEFQVKKKQLLGL